MLSLRLERDLKRLAIEKNTPSIQTPRSVLRVLDEQEPVVSNNYSEFIRDRDTRLWLAAYTKPVVRVCAALLMYV